LETIRRFLNQNHQAKGILFLLFHILFVDNSVFLFGSLKDLTKGAKKIVGHCIHSGLIMHVGGDRKK
jgi:hypothetical protein